MSPSLSPSLIPALIFIALLVAVPLALSWYRRHKAQPLEGAGVRLKQLAQLPLGPQQRVVAFELAGSHGQRQLMVVGVTAQNITLLKSLPLLDPHQDLPPIPGETR